MGVAVRKVLAKLPPLARRDRRIATLESRVRRLRSDRTVQIVRPSFEARIQYERRLARLRREMGAPSTSPNQGGKFATYDLVRSRGGVDVPKQFGQWEHPHEIPWDDLPDRVVVKSAFGSTARGVFPLQRTAGGWQVVTHASVHASQQIADQLVELTEASQIAGPYGAEELLEGPDGPNSLPTDIKAYTFYGEVPVLLLCRRREHGHRRGSQYRYIDAGGRDIEGIAPGSPTDFTIKLPENLDEIVTTAARLSRMFRTPFARIDLYSVDSRVVFGEATPRPGGKEWFGPELDTTLGQAWESAQVRLDKDLASGL